MYARYIPPSKGSKAPHASSPPPASAPVSSPPSTTAAPQAVGDAGFTYSRYIPGSKSAAQPTVSSGVQFFDDEPSPPAPKRKRDDEPRQSPQPGSKKSKKSRDVDGADGVDQSKTEETESKSSKKEKKDKKEKKPKKSQAATTNGDDSNATPAEANKDDEMTETKEERKQRKKEEKEKKKRAAPDEIGQEAEDGDTPMPDATDAPETTLNEALVEAPAKKEKKPKREKTKRDKVAEETADDDTKDGRHKVVLDRLSKSLKLAEAAPVEEEAEEEPAEVHDLEPLPQPKLVSEETPNPTYETLPPWLAAPIRVSQDTRTPFSKLGLLPKAARVMEEKGFPDAFAVQTAAIPLLLPTSKQRPGDLLISAATGSGKTLAYALPIVRDISQGQVTRLRTLVVLPTRELVKQAQEVFELCVRAYEGGERKRVRIGVAIGSQTLKSEQEHLVERQSRYDPEAYQRILDERSAQQVKATGSANSDLLLDPDFQESDPRLGEWDGQINEFSSKVDVLICTPGRLVEHIEQTPGFDLDYVRWLVVDEADKLLAQSFQGWLDVVLEKFQTRKFTAREFPDMDLEGVRKIVLSATLTRDLTLLNQLALRRPQLIVLESDHTAPVAEHALPALLEEFAVRVHNVNLKPLYLLDLLKNGHMKGSGPESQATTTEKDATESDDSDTSSEASSDTSSDDSSDTSSDDSTSDEDSDSEAKPSKSTPKSSLPVSLIFTKSNEAALRLSRLLTILDKSLSAHISTLTSTTPTHIRRKTLRTFATPESPTRIIVASDLVARGIDIPNLDHVINYDLPPSVAGYVHRVGRTARAGRSGTAWTLVGDDESGWFWGKIAKGAGIRRAQKVGRTRIEEMPEDRVETYEEALEKLGQEALDTRKR